jgi:hypothetical protein
MVGVGAASRGQRCQPSRAAAWGCGVSDFADERGMSITARSSVSQRGQRVPRMLAGPAQQAECPARLPRVSVALVRTGVTGGPQAAPVGTGKSHDARNSQPRGRTGHDQS